ncbi:glycoside hydrolase family 2 TIM barrel-domain containing protein [Leifsonia sp. H3M29-4]|uniref:glycoside hydrolase family 2 protein n=1 Tax=Salinibacterium metalliresistens TaxID=3031321 RepID=UPI0023DCAA3F|nr:sugar-binding domain-containing protein [Salinibacterium metalliresistens]MDF1478655.1 glycoside hydrolase family 2 TIM barrel-domain containing protein [Salinibacterium metalliresistens]
MSLLTSWGRDLDAESVLGEHPRPQLVREGWRVLNGWWDCAFTAAEAGRPADWTQRILVPFSPEAPLSGVGRRLTAGEALWYRRTIEAAPPGRRVLLHFGAVDRHTTVWIDDVEIGRHDDGYLPFDFEVTAALAAPGPHELVVRVTDPTDAEPGARGKQSSTPGGIWYTPQSGIWQTVWTETVPQRHVERLHLDPLLEQSAVRVTVHAEAGAPARVRVLAAGRVVAEAQVPVGEATELTLAEVRAWSPADPFLYDVEVELGDDRVRSYFGLRSLGTVTGRDGMRRLTLNGAPILHAGLLDQGYWPDGLLTPPSDAAMIHDIQTARDLGFTMLRKHIKIEPARWYHHCDRLGMLVWQDMVNGGGKYRPSLITVPAFLPWWRLDDRKHRRWFARDDAADRAAFREATRRTVDLLRDAPSVVLWVPQNEGWGQFDSLDIAREVRELDPSRPIDHVSGWHDQGGGDLASLHVYFRRFRMPSRRRVRGRAVALTEFGGYSLPIPGHRFSEREFGYKRFRDAAAFRAAIEKLWRRELEPAVRAGLAAFVYTQLSDVEDEVNGVISYDREVLKLDPQRMRELNAELAAAFGVGA